MSQSIQAPNHPANHTLDPLALYAETLGLSLVGCAPLTIDQLGWLTPHSKRITAWLKDGNHAEMNWIAARLEERCMPQALLPNAKSALVFWANHFHAPYPEPIYPTGRVARYAWGRDYHNVLRKSLRKISKWMQQEFGGFESYTSIDTGAVLERAVCQEGGLGWIGKSTMLINQKLGTFGSLAVLFTTLDLPNQETAHPFRCGKCTRCLDDCPTGALSQNGLDARRCISYWTIEHRGMIPRNFRPFISDWVFGCDICQDVCPWNRKAPWANETLWQPRAQRANPDLIGWLETDAAQLDAALLGSPLRRAKPEGLKRNACIVLANTRCFDALPVLRKAAQSDPSEVVRATAVWACIELGDKFITTLCKDDNSLLVKEELSTVSMSQ